MKQGVTNSIECHFLLKKNLKAKQSWRGGVEGGWVRGDKSNTAAWLQA